MKHPHLKKPRFVSQETVLMRWLDQVAPSSLDRACHVSMFVLCGSRRRSNQMAKKFPDSSEAIAGKNWSPGAGSPVSVVLRNRASDHVRPPSCESWIEMSAFDCGRLTLFWYT